MKKLHLDFETRSVVDVTVTGPYRYSVDASTTVLCLCYRVKDENGNLINKARITKDQFNEWFDNFCLSCVHPEIDNIDYLIGLAKDTDVRFVAHNSMFEYCMWNNVLAKRYGFPEITDFERWECTASKAATHALPRSLAKCAKALHLNEEKDETGKRVMLQLSKPKKPSKKNPTMWDNDPVKFSKLYEYCEQDVEVESAIDRAVPELNSMEREIWKLDQKINNRGIRIDTETLDKAIQFTNAFKNNLNKELAELTDGYVTKATEVKRLTDYFRNFVSVKELPSLAAATVNEFMKSCKDYKIKRILEIRQQAGKSSTKKLERMKECISDDDKVRDILVYHGASTGRWAGAGIQVQNFPRGSKEYNIDDVIEAIKLHDLDTFMLMYPDVIDAISAALRGFLIADEGKDFVAADFSAIEARVVFFLAGAERGLKAFREGADIYCDFASEIYKRPITKKDKDERQLGKTGVLGCGFQMGPDRFKAQVKTQTGLDISRDMAQLIVQAYRTTYPEVAGFWYQQENAAVQAVRQSGKIITAGPVKWKVQNGFLYCKLPSGRCLAYAEPQVKPIETSWGEIKDQLTFMAVNPINKNWERQHTYGGAITENIVQATARDLMAYGMLNLEKQGYEIRMTVHDEVIACVDENFGSVEDFERILSTTPDWAKGCPVKAEGWRGKRYRK